MMTSKRDSDGLPPDYYPGDRVYIKPCKMEATVVEQVLHYDGPETFWGNVVLLFDNGVKRTYHCWQVEKVCKT